jgi:hypothetical protein
MLSRPPWVAQKVADLSQEDDLVPEVAQEEVDLAVVLSELPLRAMSLTQADRWGVDPWGVDPWEAGP